jgi:hypothetical protein
LAVVVCVCGRGEKIVRGYRAALSALRDGTKWRYFALHN